MKSALDEAVEVIAPGKYDERTGTWIWNPFQLAFLACSADIAIGGGAAGCGKTYAILLDLLRWIHVPGYTALVLRRNEVDLEKGDSPWIKSLALFPLFGGRPELSTRTWTFPSGAQVFFGYITRDYEQQYQGTAYCAIYFDELTHFALSHFRFLLGRNRTACGVRAYVRATCNPSRDSWVRALVEWWLGPDPGGRPGSYVQKDRARRARYFLGRAGEWHWGDSREELLERFPRAKAGHVKSFMVIPGELAMNAHLGDDYEANLLLMDEHLQEAWLGGNWDAGPDTGGKFKEAWFKGRILREAPEGTRWLRVWDLAATPEAEAEHHSSFTAGTKIGMAPDGRIIIGHLVLGRWDDGDVERHVLATADADGTDVPIWFLRERAGAGKAQLQRYVRLLQGFDVGGEPESGDKEVRQGPLAAQAKAGNVYLLEDLDPRFLAHLCRAGRPDDVKDTCSAGYARLLEGGRPFTEADAKALLEANGLGQGPPPPPPGPRAPLGSGRFRL